MAIALTQPTPGAGNPQIMLDEAQLQLEVKISAKLGITAEQAKRKLTRFFMDEVSLFISPQAPLLVLTDQEAIFWRFPIVFSMGKHGQLGQVGEIDVDARSGALLLDEAILEKIKTNARILARGATNYGMYELPGPIGPKSN